MTYTLCLLFVVRYIGPQPLYINAMTNNLPDNQIKNLNSLSAKQVQKLENADQEKVQEIKPEIKSFDDIEIADSEAQAHFAEFDFAPRRLEYIIKVDLNSDLMDECRELAKYNNKFVYPYTRDKKARSDDETEAQKSAQSTVAEHGLSMILGSNAKATDETKHDYDCDVIVGSDDDIKIDVKTTNVNSKGYNIPIRRYGYESIHESLDKKDRDYLVQSYSISKNGYLFIGFEFAFNIKTALRKYDPVAQKRNEYWDWYKNEDGLKTWRTINTKKLNMHLFNAKTARADDDVTVPIDSLC